MGIPLIQFINNLETFNKKPIVILKKNIIEIIGLILRQMAKYTIDDSGRARSLIIKKFADAYGIKYDDLDRDYHFWDAYYGSDSGRDFDGKDSTMAEAWSNQTYALNITADDESLFKQEMGVLEPSDLHSRETGRNNSDFKPRMIQFVTDQVNRGSWNEVDGLEKEIDWLVNDIIDYLTKGKVS